MTEKKYRFAHHTGTIIWCADQLTRLAYPAQKLMSDYIHKRKWYIGGADGNYLRAKQKYNEACSELDHREDITDEQYNTIQYVQTVYSLANRDVQDIQSYIDWAAENAGKSWGNDVADEMLKSMLSGDVDYRDQAVEIARKNNQYRLRKQKQQQENEYKTKALKEQERRRAERQRIERNQLYNRTRDGRLYCTETDPIVHYFIGQDGFHTIRTASDGVLYETLFSNNSLYYRDVFDRNYPVKPCSDVKTTDIIDRLLDSGCMIAENPENTWVLVCGGGQTK